MSSGNRTSQWSRGEFVGMKVGVRGSSMRDSDAYVRKSARGLQKEPWCGEEVACSSPPKRTDVWGCSTVSRVYDVLVCLVFWFGGVLRNVCNDVKDARSRFGCR